MSAVKIMPSTSFTATPAPGRGQSGCFSHTWHSHPAAPQFHTPPPGALHSPMIVKRHSTHSGNLFKNHLQPAIQSQARPTEAKSLLTFPRETKPHHDGPSNLLLTGPAIEAKSESDEKEPNRDGLLPTIVTAIVLFKLLTPCRFTQANHRCYQRGRLGG
jgi:hypothetical protein